MAALQPTTSRSDDEKLSHASRHDDGGGGGVSDDTQREHPAQSPKQLNTMNDLPPDPDAHLSSEAKAAVVSFFPQDKTQEDTRHKTQDTTHKTQGRRGGRGRAC